MLRVQAAATRVPSCGTAAHALASSLRGGLGGCVSQNVRGVWVGVVSSCYSVLRTDVFLDTTVRVRRPRAAHARRSGGMRRPRAAPPVTCRSRPWARRPTAARSVEDGCGWAFGSQPFEAHRRPRALARPPRPRVAGATGVYPLVSSGRWDESPRPVGAHAAGAAADVSCKGGRSLAASEAAAACGGRHPWPASPRLQREVRETGGEDAGGVGMCRSRPERHVPRADRRLDTTRSGSGCAGGRGADHGRRWRRWARLVAADGRTSELAAGLVGTALLSVLADVRRNRCYGQRHGNATTSAT